MIAFIEKYKEKRKKITRDRENRRKIMHLIDDHIFHYDVSVPVNHKELSLYPLEDSDDFYIIVKKFMTHFTNIEKCILFAGTNWGIEEVLSNEDINLMFAKYTYDYLKNNDKKSFF